MSKIEMRRETTDARKTDARREALDAPHASRLTPRRVSSLTYSVPWPKAKLGEICNIFTGKKDVNQTVADGPYRFFSCAPTLFCSNEYIFDGAAIIVAGNGSYTGRVTYYEGKFDLYQRTYACTIAKPHLVDIKFIYDAMRLRFQNEIRGSLKGASIPYIVKGHLSNFEIPLPPLPVQRRIADILSAYDDLIENNRRRIAILEETARLAYRKWFGGVEQCGTATLGEIAPFVRGKVITLKNAVHGKVPVVAGGLEPAYFHNVANTGAPVITISGSGANAGFTRMYFEPIWASDCSWCDKSKTKYFYFSYCFLKDNADALRNLQQGAAQPHVYPKDINALEVALPKSDDLLDNFEESVEPLFSQCGVLAKQNTALASARDMLLPRLMKGELV